MTTSQEYAEQILSCEDPDQVVKLWLHFQDTVRKQGEEQVIALYRTPGISDKLLWGLKNETPKEPTKMPKSNYDRGRIKVGDSVVWCPQRDKIECVEKYGPVSHLLGKTWVVEDVIGPHPTNQRKQYVSIKLEGEQSTFGYHEDFFKVVDK